MVGRGEGVDGAGVGERRGGGRKGGVGVEGGEADGGAWVKASYLGCRPWSVVVAPGSQLLSRLILPRSGDARRGLVIESLEFVRVVPSLLRAKCPYGPSQQER